jgi:hypothetical protein
MSGSISMCLIKEKSVDSAHGLFGDGGSGEKIIFSLLKSERNPSVL